MYWISKCIYHFFHSGATSLSAPTHGASEIRNDRSLIIYNKDRVVLDGMHFYYSRYQNHIYILVHSESLIVVMLIK